MAQDTTMMRTARLLHQRLQTEAHDCLPAEPAEYTIERIFRAVVGTAQAIRATMPADVRMKGSGRFLIQRQGTGHWEGYPNQSVEVTHLIMLEAIYTAALDRDLALKLAQALIDEIRSGAIDLPGFDREIALRWERSHVASPFAVP